MSNQELLMDRVIEIQDNANDVEFYLDKLVTEYEEEIESLKTDLQEAEELIDEYRRNDT